MEILSAELKIKPKITLRGKNKCSLSFFLKYISLSMQQMESNTLYFKINHHDRCH